MPTVIVTGSGGLIGSEAVSYFAEHGYDVVGIDNDMRAYFFGGSASTRPQTQRLTRLYPNEFRSADIDIRDAEAIGRIFRERGADVALVVHAAAQPSHDWAAAEPVTDFTINANGTLNLLEATRRYCLDAPFVFTSTNKVYGDRPNSLPLEELATRFELTAPHRYHRGIDTSMSIDESLHSLFGASKVAADVLVQEYGRYFHMPTVCFRGGCLTGPNHAGAQLHGFLSYLMRCTVTGAKYTVHGYSGKQVRDNIHSADLVRAFDAFRAAPRAAAVYNIGGGRDANCSMLEAIELCQEVAGRELDWTLDESARVGDHRWWISDLAPFRADYPGWSLSYGIEEILREIYDRNAEAWLSALAVPADIRHGPA
jgi:CDP-paratose 2-epimerase